jgi:hypothetical protein
MMSTTSTLSGKTSRCQSTPRRVTTDESVVGQESVIVLPATTAQMRAAQGAPITDSSAEEGEIYDDDGADDMLEVEEQPETQKLVEEPEPLLVGARRSSRYHAYALAPARQQTYQAPPPQRTYVSHHVKVWLVAGLLAAVGLYVLVYLCGCLCLSFYNRLTYGPTPTSFLVGVVGDHDSVQSPTQFEAMNVHGRIQIIEMPGGDLTHEKVYPGPILSGPEAGGAVIDLVVKDVNHDGRPDIVMQVTGGMNIFFQRPVLTFVLLNSKNGFKPLLQQ